MWWIIALVALVVFLVVFPHYWAGGGSSLLSDDVMEDPPPLETDQSKRDAVLKQNFSPEKVPEKLDAIVIGSGLGGLSAAVYMARAGRKVLVLEQHDQVGGTMHTFLENGFEFDVGLHYLGYLWDQTSAFTMIMKNITKGKVVFDRIPGAADHVAIGTPGKDFREYKAFGGFLFDNLLQQFPEDREKILKFKKMSDNIINQFLVVGVVKLLPLCMVKLIIKSGILKYTLFKYYDTPMLQVLDDLGIENPDLRACFTYMTTIVALDATTCPFMLYALIIQMYQGPAYYPRGGPTEIPLHLVPQVEQAGGKVLVNAMVEEILFSGSGRAHGVRVGKGLKKCDVFAPVIISDAGLLATFKEGMIPRPILEKSRYTKFVKTIGPSLSCIQVFVGLDRASDELDLPTSNIWYLRESNSKETPEVEHFPEVEVMSSKELPWFYSTCSSKKNTGWDARFPGKSVVLMVVFGPYEFFEKHDKGTVRHRGEEYQNVKDDIARNCWDKFTQLYPKAADHVEYFEVGTPLSYNHYLNTTRGEVFALAHHSARMSATAVAEMRTKTDIPGLFLTGQDTLFAGIPVAALSGLITASEVMGKLLPVELIVLEKNARVLQWLRSKAKAWLG